MSEIPYTDEQVQELVKDAFPIGCRVQMFDRYRFGSHDVYGTVAKHDTGNDGVAVAVDEEHQFLLANKRDTHQWFRPQQLIRIQDAKPTGEEAGWEGDITADEAAVGLNFGQMMEGIKLGDHYARAGWNGKGIFIAGQFPDEHSKMTQPYIYIVTLNLVSDDPAAVRGQVPWLASQTDMFAEDWIRL